jgi:hypothetical protein
VDELELALPTGALIAGDAAAVFADARPLVEDLPTGTFPAYAVAGGLEVRLGEAEPVYWSEPERLETPSGYAALLDAASLAEYTDLGDELAERFGARDVARFQDVLAVRGTGGAAVLTIGSAADGEACRIVLRFEQPQP